MLQAGNKAPDFQAPSTQGPFMLSSLLGKEYAVLIFYPKNNTPG